jgi:tetrapyrrole methylase family protein/MazG family protein
MNKESIGLSKRRVAGQYGPKKPMCWRLAAISEMEELADAASSGGDVEGELGDVLANLHHYAFLLGIDPDVAIRRSVSKVNARLDYIEKNTPPGTTLSLARRKELWDEAKRAET